MSTKLQPACADNIEFITGTAFSSPLPSKRLTRAIARHDVQGVVLAGGRSSRMGSDKALLHLGGRPLIDYAMDILRNAGLPISISGSRADLVHLAPVIADVEPSQGPLNGICSTLQTLAESWIVLLTVDMPLVPSSLVELMLEVAIDCNAAVVLPSFADRLYPFPCVLQRQLLSGLISEQAAGRYGCLEAISAAALKIGKPLKAVQLESLKAGSLQRHQHRFPIDAWLFNVNFPEDLRRAERLIAAGPSGTVLKGKWIEAGALQ